MNQSKTFITKPQNSCFIYYVLSTIQSSLFASFRSKQKYCQNFCIRSNKVPMKLSLFMRCAKACKTLRKLFLISPKLLPFQKRKNNLHLSLQRISNYLLSKFHGLDSLHFALESRQANFVQTGSVVPRVLQITTEDVAKSLTRLNSIAIFPNRLGKMLCPQSRALGHSP
jgi:hypothetical protein